MVEYSPIHVSPEPGGTTCRIWLLSNGPPLRTTAISPAAVLSNPLDSPMNATSSTIPPTTTAAILGSAPIPTRDTTGVLPVNRLVMPSVHNPASTQPPPQR